MARGGGEAANHSLGNWACRLLLLCFACLLFMFVCEGGELLI